MTRLDREHRQLLNDVLSSLGGVQVPDEEVVSRFDEVIEMLGDYLITYGIAPDGSLNELGHRVEGLEDWLTRERIDNADKNER